jgi:hypothetical protein
MMGRMLAITTVSMIAMKEQTQMHPNAMWNCLFPSVAMIYEPLATDRRVYCFNVWGFVRGM